MGTSSSEIFDLFLTSVDDYRLTAIYQSSGSATLNTFLEPWLLQSVVEFDDICNQDLGYTEVGVSGDGEFAEDLTLENKSVLSRLMVKYWLIKTVNNILNMNLVLQDHDFKLHSAGQNLREKQTYLATVREDTSQMLVDYALKHNAWDEWRNQIFAGSS